jgi:GT2 family glycosyltransferase
LVAGGQQTGFDPEEARTFLESDGADCDFVVFGLSGASFAANALARIAEAFDRYENADIVYGDVDIPTQDGGRWPLTFPAFDYERMLEQGYCAYLFAMRRTAAQQSLARGASNLYRLFNSAFDGGLPKPENVVHLPGALAIIPAIRISEASETLSTASSRHLSARGIKALVTPGAGASLPAAHVVRPVARGKTTVIIPTRNRASLLRRCLETIRPAIEKASAEILIVDNDSTDPETLDYLERIASDTIEVLRVEGPFNFARLNNIAARTVTSDHLCLLNNDVEAIDDRWLEEMLGRIAEPDVGAVGALLLWPSGVIQHGGVVLGPAFSARHAFNDRVDGDPGPGDLLRVARQCGAVTAACLLTRRSDYLQVAGMDEINFSVAFNDVDYCLKLRAIGKRIVFTPHARLSHLESASRGHDDHPDRAPRYRREVDALRARWADTLMADPCYSPLLSLDAVPYSALAWPPRSLDARWPVPPIPKDVPPGL